MLFGPLGQHCLSSPEETNEKKNDLVRVLRVLGKSPFESESYWLKFTQ